MNPQLLEIVNVVRANKGRPVLPALTPEMRLREDCQLDYLDLAELTVRIEEASGVDVFADGVVRTIGEIQAKLPR
jgi:acyl carrier protein